MTRVSPGLRTFGTTQWSVVLRAGDADDPEARAALADLCGRYWFPLYAFLRRRGADVELAQDLTQAFFTRVLEHRLIDRAAPERGRFRSFLLTALSNFAAHEWERGQALKRGGGTPALSLDVESGESRLSREPAHDLTAERLFEREWALTLLDVVLGRLREELSAAGKARQFETLKAALAGAAERLPYAEIARELGLSEDAARQAASRLRKRYRELLREEVGATVAAPEDVDEEIRRLFEALG